MSFKASKLERYKWTFQIYGLPTVAEDKVSFFWFLLKMLIKRTHYKWHRKFRARISRKGPEEIERDDLKTTRKIFIVPCWFLTDDSYSRNHAKHCRIFLVKCALWLHEKWENKTIKWVHTSSLPYRANFGNKIGTQEVHMVSVDWAIASWMGCPVSPLILKRELFPMEESYWISRKCFTLAINLLDILFFSELIITII